MVGCCGFGDSRDRYLRRLRLVEVQETFFAPPKAATLARWRQRAPADFVFLVRAWQLITHEAGAKGFRRLPPEMAPDPGSCGLFRNTAEVAEAYRRTADAATELRAPAIVFESPQSFTPTAANRRNMSSFFERIDRQQRALVWFPRGLWSVEEVSEICRDLSLVPGWSTLDDAAPDAEPPRYLRLEGPRYGDEALYQLATRLPPRGRTFCLFNTVNMVREASRLQTLLDAP
jgi:uncharacterized protein YecE (DUF72 family)